MRKLAIESLPSSKFWIDRDEIMLHSCFQILKDCVEKENICEDPFKNKDIIKEIKFLYKWWNKRNKSLYTDKQIIEDESMLLRLIKIRTSLWT